VADFGSVGFLVSVEIVDVFVGLASLAEASVAAFVSPEALVVVFVIAHAIVAVYSQKHLGMQGFCLGELLQEGRLGVGEPGLI
jgi:hypothetical protein